MHILITFVHYLKSFQIFKLKVKINCYNNIRLRFTFLLIEIINEQRSNI